MLYIVNTMKKQALLYHVSPYDTKKVPIWTRPPQSTIYSYAKIEGYTN